jgi:membrane-bound metal-dependent hydrolase YbcI (DUF457 family)
MRQKVLAAHLAPGYFAAVKSQSLWKPEWGRKQRILLWIVALSSTIAPDLDVIYNVLFRGFFNHSTLWTHSIFAYIVLCLGWWLLGRNKRWFYFHTLVGLAVVGGLSHLVLDVISHGTPLFYPLSLYMVGAPPQRVLQGGVLGYITHPIFLAEPILLAVPVAHWLMRRGFSTRVTKLALLALASGVIVFSAIFLSLLPVLQSVVVI